MGPFGEFKFEKNLKNDLRSNSYYIRNHPTTLRLLYGALKRKSVYTNTKKMQIRDSFVSTITFFLLRRTTGSKDVGFMQRKRASDGVVVNRRFDGGVVS